MKRIKKGEKNMEMDYIVIITNNANNNVTVGKMHDARR